MKCDCGSDNLSITDKVRGVIKGKNIIFYECLDCGNSFEVE